MHSRRHFLTATAMGAALLGSGLLAGPAQASLEAEAKAFLTDMGNRAIADLTDQSVPDGERIARFRTLLREAVDFPLIAQQVLGRHWRNADEAQRKEFNTVLRETLIHRFKPLFDKYEGQSFDVVSTRTSSQDPTVVAATTNVRAPNGNIAKVEWYMKKFDAGLKIYDFSAEGVRLTISLQDEYNAVLRQSGGDINALIAEMKRKLPATADLS